MFTHKAPILPAMLMCALFLAALSGSLQQAQAQQRRAARATAQDSLCVSAINIFGNKITREQIILRELSIRTGTKIAASDPDSLMAAERTRVYNTNLFNIVEVDWMRVEGDSIAVNISVVERWYLFPVPVLELADRNFNEWWNNRNRDLSRLNLGFFVTHSNFRGMKEKIYLRVQGGFTKRFTLNYEVPYIDKKQSTSLSFLVGYNDNRTTGFVTSNNRFLEVRRGDVIARQAAIAGITVGKRYGFYDFHHLSLRFNWHAVDDTIAQLNPDYFLDGRNQLRFFQAAYTFDKNRRDFDGYPLKGYQVSVTLRKTGLGIFNDLNMFATDIRMAKYFDMGKRFYFASGLSGKLSFPRDQPYSEMRALGYNDNIIRGLDNYVMEGQHVGVVKNTLRWKLLEETINLKKIFFLDQFSVFPVAVYPKAYFDFGYVHNPGVTFDNRRLANKPLWGGGLGLDVVTSYNAVVRLEYSWNQFREPGFYFYYTAEL